MIYAVDPRIALLEAEIVASAKDHGGRYLLMRRPSVIEENELRWRACENLVARREARWLPQNSSLAPGIELRGPFAT